MKRTATLLVTAVLLICTVSVPPSWSDEPRRSATADLLLFSVSADQLSRQQLERKVELLEQANEARRAEVAELRQQVAKLETARDIQIDRAETWKAEARGGSVSRTIHKIGLWGALVCGGIELGRTFE